MRITVIGTGYLGAVHAACMAELGHSVLGVDSRPDRIARLARGEAPFFEPGLSELLTRGIESGRLFFGGSLEEALAAHLHSRKDEVSPEERNRLIGLIEQAQKEGR